MQTRHRMIYKQSMKLMLLVVILVLVPTNVLCRYRSAKRAGVQLGCCPSSFSATVKVYNANGEPDSLVITYWDSGKRRAASQTADLNVVYENRRTVSIDPKNDCLMSNLADPSNYDLDPYFCLTSDMTYDGQRTVQLADGNLRLADVYSRQNEFGTETRFYDPSKSTCVIFGGYFKGDYSNDLYGSVVQTLEFGNPPESVFRVPEAKCQNSLDEFIGESWTTVE